MRLQAVPATVLLAGLAASALVSAHAVWIAALGLTLLVVCIRAPQRARWLYVFAAVTSAAGVFVVWPFLAVHGATILWSGPTLPVLGPLDVRTEELELGLVYSLRIAALALAFAAYTLRVDHDRLLGALSFARRATLAVALATRLVPTLERDASGFAEAVRGRGVALAGIRGHARLLSPLVAGSLERSLDLAESMEARGYGARRPTRAPGRPWTSWDRAALAAAAVTVLVGALWR